MQTTRDQVISGGVQQPLLRADQLVPGALVTGIAMSFAWEVMRVDGDQLEIVKLPRATVSCANGRHEFSAYGRGQVCSRCQLRRQAIAEFLPRTENKPRAHVITCDAQLRTPMPYTLYGYVLGGNLKTVSLNGQNQWSEALPVIPSLHVLWTIPEGLRARMGRTSDSGDEQEIPF